MKNILKICLVGSLIFMTSCGKKKCNTCPDWGKTATENHQVEKA
ncbi:MAG: hypothetical protein R2799_08205 [Crocinitomicaceae bacterium]